MSRRHHSVVCLALCLLVVPHNAFAGLTITMNYTAFAGGPAGGNASNILTNDAYDATTTDADRINDAIAVMDTAASMVEALFFGVAESLSQTIAVGWETYTDSTLATGGTSWNGTSDIFDGELNWDQDGSSVFFVDTTPLDNSEYSGSSTRGVVLPGANPGNEINAENRYYSGAGAASNSDMLSVAIHEILHALGVLGPYPPYDNLDVGNDGDLDLTAFGNTYEVDYTGGHTDLTLDWPGSGTLSGDYYPNVLGPSIVNGTRGLLTDLDTLLLANVHGLGATDYSTVNQPFGTVTAVPEMSPSIYLSLATCVLLVIRRSNANL